MTNYKVLRSAAVAAILVGLTTHTAQAGEMDSGAYLGLSGVGTIVKDVGFNNNRATNKSTNTAKFDNGYGGMVRAGYDYGSVRAEIELGARKVDIDGVTTGTTPSGDVTAYTLMLNGAWDIDTGTAATPYIMLGVGGIKADGDIRYTDSDGTDTISQSFSGTAPAGQVGLGLAYAVSPDVDVVGGYSFLASPANKSNVDETIQIHSIQLGLNFAF